MCVWVCIWSMLGRSFPTHSHKKNKTKKLTVGPSLHLEGKSNIKYCVVGITHRKRWKSLALITYNLCSSLSESWTHNQRPLLAGNQHWTAAKYKPVRSFLALSLLQPLPNFFFLSLILMNPVVNVHNYM